MATVSDPRAAFVHALARPDPEIDLGHVALLIAAEEYPDLDIDLNMRRLDELADGVRPRLSGDEGPAGVVACINGHLFRDIGFRGNHEDFYDPRNSLLNDVLERRTGIPITLSIVYREVAKRLGFHLIGINFPMHFVLGWPLRDQVLVVDVFQNGAILTEADCAERLTAITGRQMTVGPNDFVSVGPRLIIRRLLNNLRAVHTQREDYRRAISMVERMHLSMPIPEDVREMGLLHLRLKHFAEAEVAFIGYLEAAPGAPDRGAIEQHLDWARRNLADRH